MKTDLLELNFPELQVFVQDSLGESPFRAKQLWIWLWRKRAKSFDQMTDLSKNLRAKLEEIAEINWPELKTVQKSKDSTVKMLLELKDGALVETVLIPSESRTGKERLTQCLSTQVGCAMACTFCSTGQMGLNRNMSSGEILGQVLLAKDYLGDDDPAEPILRNLVFMGMGEPFLNYEELMKSLETLNDEQGLAYSPRRITVSTCGIEKGLWEFGEKGLAFLAISLHAPTQELREEIMPKAAKWPLDEMMEVLKSYPLNNREHLTFEYLMMGGVNDSLNHAKDLSRLLAGTKAKVNLIAYNPTPGMPYKASRPDDILAFEKYLWSKDIVATLRKSKGQDIDAACGQLSTKYLAE